MRLDSIKTGRNRQRLASATGVGYDVVMSFDVYSSAKPAVPVRGWACSVGLLLGVTALAWSMSAGRTEGHLGAVESSSGLGFSLRLPNGFTRLDVKRFGEGTVRRYASNSNGSPLIFSIWSFDDAEKLTAHRVCDLVLKASSDSSLQAMIDEHATVSKGLVGDVLGTEVDSPAQAMVVRAVVAGDVAVAFALHGRDPVSVRGGYAGFDLSCRSVKFGGE